MMNAAAVIAQAPGLEATSVERIAGYGVIGICCLVFAFVIRHLYRENRSDQAATSERAKKDALTLAEREKAHELECVEVEKKHILELEKLRGDYEKRHREILEGYTAQLTQIRASLDKREDDIRRDNQIMIDKLANANKVANEALVDMLQQFLNKVVK